MPVSSGTFSSLGEGAEENPPPKLPDLLAECRWGRVVGNHFLHGFTIKNLSQQQKDELLLWMRQTLQAFQRENSDKKEEAA